MREPDPDLARVSVYKQLRSEILSCELRPGLRLHEKQLAARFAISKSPIRDALLRLEEQNLVEVLPRRGYRVAPISIQDARELYDMRSILERECVSRLVDVASDDTLADLDRFSDAPTLVELSSWIDYNRKFHVALADGCGNARLARAARDVIEQFDRLTVMSVIYEGAPRLFDYVGEHRKIISAIHRRDRRQAVALMKSHVESSRRRMLKALSNFPVTQ